MAENPQEQFSLISVHSEEEDDLVIQAGYLPAKEVSDAVPSSASASEEDQAEYLAHRQKREERLAAQEMLTTEEDLHAQMPYARMQRIIMVLLLIMIAGAVVYWFFLR